MITITDQLKLSNILTLEPRASNFTLSGETITIETINEYLVRVPLENRHLGLVVTVLSPSGNYNINTFISLINIGSITGAKYSFKNNLNDLEVVSDDVIIVDNLTSTDPARVLSANQGSVLKRLIDEKADALGTNDNYVTDTEKSALHSHSNKSILDLVSGVNTGDQDLSNFVVKESGKSLVSNTEIAKIHTQGTDQGLDTGGANAVTAAQAKAAYTHSTSAHAPSDAVSLATVKSDTQIAAVITSTHVSGSDNQVASDFDIKDLTDSTGLRSTWSGKQAELVSGTNIKTINNTSILGSGNITIAGSGGGAGGDVAGPSSAVNNNFAAFDTTTGKLIKDSGSKAADFATTSSIANMVVAALAFGTDNKILRSDGTSRGAQSGNAYLFDSGNFYIGSGVENEYSRVLVYGGANGANIDARGEAGNYTDQAIFEAMSNDYETTFRSAWLGYLGTTRIGTTLGITNANLGIIALNGNNNIIYSAFNSPIIFGTNNLERGRWTGSGAFKVNNLATAATSLVTASTDGTLSTTPMINVSGTNTGDETQSTIKTKLGAATDLADGYLTSTDHATFAAKQSALGFTPENVANKVTSFQVTPDNTHYPTEKLVKDSLDGKQPSGTYSTDIHSNITALNAVSGTNTGDELDATTTVKGIVELATDGENAANVVVQGNDSRLSNSRTPTSHGNEAHSSTFITQTNAVVPNVTITGATKTKITYDAKGLVTSGADATTADISASTNKNYVTDTQLIVIGNTSNTNTGDNATNSQYSGLATSKQDTLVSGTNIKTINSTSLLGSGNIEISGGGGSGTTVEVSVAQTSHGLSVGNAIRVSGANTFAKAQANSSANAEVIGFVSVVTDVNNFKYASHGYVTTGVPTATAGTVYFLDPTTAGALTSTEPTTVGLISKPLLIVLESAAKALILNLRGLKITSASTSTVDEVWTSISGVYASTSTFTFTGTDKDVGLIQLSLLTLTDSAGTTRKIGYVKSAVNNSGTITATVVTNADLASGDKDFKVAYNRKVNDYQHLISIPGEVIADASYSQGVWLQDLPINSYLLPVDASVLTAAAGSGAACAFNVYKNTTALFSSAPDMTINAVLRSQRPTSNTITATDSISLRITSSAGATNKAADFQAKLYIVPVNLFTSF